MTEAQKSGTKKHNHNIMSLRQEDKADTNICPECNGHILLNLEGGDCVCEQCGLVIEEKYIDTSKAGERIYDATDEKRKARTGQPLTPLMAHMAFSTIVNRKEANDPDLKRALKWNTRVGGDMRSLLLALSEIRRIGANLFIPYYIRSAASIVYRAMARGNYLRGRHIKKMVTACLYFACRLHKLPRNLDDMLESNASSKHRRKVMNCYKLIVKEIGLNPKTISPIYFVPRYLSELKLNGEVESLVIKVYETYVAKTRVSGSSPFGICAGAIYFVCKHKDLKKTQEEIAKIVGVTEVTLRKKYKDIESRIRLR